MSTRIDPFASLKEPPVFTTKPKADKPVVDPYVRQLQI